MLGWVEVKAEMINERRESFSTLDPGRRICEPPSRRVWRLLNRFLKDRTQKTQKYFMIRIRKLKRNDQGITSEAGMGRATLYLQFSWENCRRCQRRQTYGGWGWKRGGRRSKEEVREFWAKLFACQIDGGQHVGNAAATGIEVNCTDYKVQASSNTGLRIKRQRNYKSSFGYILI